MNIYLFRLEDYCELYDIHVYVRADNITEARQKGKDKFLQELYHEEVGTGGTKLVKPDGKIRVYREDHEEENATVFADKLFSLEPEIIKDDLMIINMWKG